MDKLKFSNKKIILIAIITFIPFFLITYFIFSYGMWNNHDIGSELISSQNIILSLGLVCGYFGSLMLGFKNKKLILLYLPIVSLVGYIIFQSVIIYYSSFSIDKWSNHKEVRYLMVLDIIETKQLDGLNRTEVMNLLGSDDAVNKQLNINEQLVYVVHDYSWLLYTSKDVLIVSFDDADNVYAYWIENYRE